MSLSNLRPILTRVALGPLLTLTTLATANAGQTWGEVSPAPTQLVAQPVRPIWLRPRPMYIAGYAGTTYPPVGTRWRAMRANYAQVGARGWFLKQKTLR
jgi:hypothetical protein